MPNPITKQDVRMPSIKITRDPYIEVIDGEEVQKGWRYAAYAVYSVETDDGVLDRRLSIELSSDGLKAAQTLGAVVFKAVKEKEGLR